MLCVATFRWLCHFAEPGYSVFQVPRRTFCVNLTKSYQILRIVGIPLASYTIRIMAIGMVYSTFTVKSVYELLPGSVSPKCWILLIRMGELYF